MSRIDLSKYAGTYGGYLPDPPPKVRAGVLCRLGSAWVGVHWSPVNRRICINVVPFVTVWVTLPGGVTP